MSIPRMRGEVVVHGLMVCACGGLVAASSKPGLSAETRAHFAEAAETLGEALSAPLIRTGV